MSNAPLTSMQLLSFLVMLESSSILGIDLERLCISSGLFLIAGYSAVVLRAFVVEYQLSFLRPRIRAIIGSLAATSFSIHSLVAYIGLDQD